MCTYASYRMLRKNFWYLGRSLLREPKHSGNSALRITFDVEALSQKKKLAQEESFCGDVPCILSDVLEHCRLNINFDLSYEAG